MVNSTRKVKRINSLKIPGSDTKKFNRKELEEACKRLNNNRSEITGEKRLKGHDFNLTIQQSDNGTESQVRSLDTGVKICARKYNECKARADRLEEELVKKKDEIIELQREGNVLEEMVKGNNREAKKITKLNKEITEANTNSESKMRYRLQLNHMHQRQRKNSITVDAHMSEMSSALSAAERERDKCLKMLGDIESGVSSALYDLDSTSEEIFVERAKREQSLNDKKTEVKNAQKLEEWRNKQELNRREFEQSIGGAFQLEKEIRINLIREREEALKTLSRDNEKKDLGQNRSSEEAFMHIKRAIGVNNLEEMVDKLTNYQEQRNRLQNDKKDAEDRLQASKLTLDKKRNEFIDLKANGPIGNDIEFHRDNINEIKVKIKQEQAEVKSLRSTNARLEAVLVGLRQGGMGLYQRIPPFHSTLLDCEAPLLKENASSSVVDVANDTLEMLKIAQKVISKMIDAIGGIDKITTSNQEKLQSSEIDSIEKFENPNLGENNCRIQAKITPPCSHRDEFDDNNLDVDEGEVDKLLLSRSSLKRISEKQAGDARKQEEIEQREQKKQTNDGTGTTIAKKLQEESIIRMSKASMPIGLPQTVNLRDDPLKKAQAFLYEVPTID